MAMDEIRIAFVGFRHGHILSLYERARQTPGVRIVAACEEHGETRQRLAAEGAVAITHSEVSRLLAEVDFDAVAVGDVYARRGGIVAAALESGRHAIADKPLCTRLADLERIRALSAAGGLEVGCMFTMRDCGYTRALRQLLRTGAIGPIHAVQFGGQHPLMRGARPAWYFEPGQHGGTINDIGIHAIDCIPWITGLRFARIEAARCWNAFVPEAPHFGDGAQLLLTMDNGCGVVGDVSYFAPDGPGYRLPHYWRLTFWGRGGVIEGAHNADHLDLALAQGGQVEGQPLLPDDEGGYFRAFLKGIRGQPRADGELTTQQVLASTETALRVQAAADRGERGVEL